MQNGTDHDFLTVAELQDALRIGRDTAYRLVEDGTIPSVRLGRSIRIPRQALLDHLDELAREAVRV